MLRLLIALFVLLLAAPAWADPPNSRTCADGGRSRACRTADESIHVRDTRGRWKKLPKQTMKEADPLPNPDPVAADVIVSNDPVTMDVLFVVPSDVESMLGGQDAVRAFAQLAVDDSNQSYANSGVADRLRLAGVVFHTWNLATDSSQPAATRLNELRIDSTIAAQKVAYGADLIHGLVANGGTVCGVGYVGGEFSMADYRCQAQLSITHEIGHNQGLHHDKLQGGAPDCGPTSGAYNCGKGFTEFRTVMAYQGGTRVKVFSSPTATWNGQTTGTDWEDNARKLRETAPSVAARRTAPALIGTSPSGLTWTPAPTGTAPSGLTWTPSVATTAAQPRIVYKLANYPIEIEGSSQGRPMTEAQISVDTVHGLWLVDSHGQATVQAITAPWHTLPAPSQTNTCPFQWFYQWPANPWKQANCPDCYLGIWIPWAECNPFAQSFGGTNGYYAFSADNRPGGTAQMHEFGHMLGLNHANTEHCQTVNGQLSCTYENYGDKDDIMGSSISAFGFQPLTKLKFGWAWHANSGLPYIPGQIVYDAADTPGEYWVEEQTIRTNLLHKALIIRPLFHVRYSLSVDRGVVRIRTHELVKDLDPVSAVSDHSLDVGQSYDITVAAGWGTPAVTWRVTNIGFEGTGVRVRIEDLN